MKFEELQIGKSYKFIETDGKMADGTPRLKTMRGRVLHIYEHSVLVEIETKGGRRFKKGFNRTDSLNFEIQKMPPPLVRKEDTARKKNRRATGATLEDLYYFVQGYEARDLASVVDMFRRVEDGNGNRTENRLYDTAVKKYQRYKQNHGDSFKEDFELEKAMRDILKG